MVDVFTSSREFNFQHFFAVFSFDLFRPAEILDSTVVTFRPPSDIVQVAHGIHHQNVDIGWQKEHVLDEASEHVPWFEVHE